MNATRQRIVSQARLWVGTPYVHQASKRGAGTDCLGLLRGIWRALYGNEPEDIPAYSMDWSEPRGEERLWRAARRHLLLGELGQEAPGDVLLFRMRERSVAKHLGVLSQTGPTPRFIHAYSGHGVVESTLSTPWRRKVVACFSFPEEIN